MDFMSWALAISIALLGYIYAGYPALIWLLARGRPRPVRKGPFAGGVSVLIAAYNEAEALPRKLDHLLDLARTEPIREIWIGLDGCTDGTGEQVKEKIRISNIQCSISNVQGGSEEGPEVRGQRSDDQPATGNRQPEPAIYLLEFETRRGKAATMRRRKCPCVVSESELQCQVTQGQEPRLCRPARQKTANAS